MAAGLGILLTGPLMLLIMLTILVESGSPVFFTQTRLGQGGRHFRILKFRKFGKSSEEAGLPLTMHQDARLSHVGRLLVASKLDELPQLFNVLKGDMSLVGPRPESLTFSDCFAGDYRAVLAYRPGIFGPSQVAFRNECTLYPPNSEPTRFYREVLFPHKAQLDLSYYPHRTLRSDCAWIARGVLAVAELDRGPAAVPLLVFPNGNSLAEGRAGTGERS
ncbi:sugar transferase [Siccirubricoccus sp. G192]|nr:sugar transferase [Siccirubricoccus sp. G192]